MFGNLVFGTTSVTSNISHLNATQTFMIKTKPNMTSDGRPREVLYLATYTRRPQPGTRLPQSEAWYVKATES